MTDWLSAAFAASPYFSLLALEFYVGAGLLLVPSFRRWIVARLAPVVPTGQPRLTQLDGVRGILALIVMAAHYNAPPPSDLFYASVINAGSAVCFFAMISGYVLYGPLKRKPLTEFDVRSFIVRRICRIMPLFVAMTLFVFAGIAALNGWRYVAVHLLPLSSNLVMLDLLGYGRQLEWAAWSLYPEMLYSLLLPVVVATISRRPLLINVAIYLVFVYYAGSADQFLRLFRFFWIGMIVRDVQDYTVARGWASKGLPWPVAAFAVGLAALLAYPEFDIVRHALAFLSDKHYGYLGLGPWLNGDIAFFLLMLALTHQGAVSWVFSLRPLVMLGTISYGIYLSFWPLAFLFHGTSFNIDHSVLPFAMPYPAGQAGVFWLVYLPAVLAVSVVLYLVVERPFIALGRRLQTVTSAQGGIDGIEVGLGERRAPQRKAGSPEAVLQGNARRPATPDL
jgi:peptidoglycan/LPS O-acetylase OafA/YrhL